VFTNTGSYTVTIVTVYNCHSDTIHLPVNITETGPVVTLTGNFTVCAGEKRTYTAGGASSYSWSTGANTTTISLTHTATAVYSVTGTGANTCKTVKSFTVSVSKCTGIKDIVKASLSLYPNPFGPEISISTDKPLQLVLYTALGSVSMSRTLNAGETTLDTGTLDPGIYTFFFKGDQVAERRRVIKKE
jgi:hypothetical protein